MTLTVMTLMQSKPKIVSPEMTLTQLELLFLESGFTGFPVVREERLVGVVSRSDIVRSLVTERSRAEQASDFYFSVGSHVPDAASRSLEAIAAQVGVRFERMKVEDVMIRQVVTVEPSDSVRALAQIMLDGHFHRLPVVDAGRLVGLVTTMDLVRAIAEGRFSESDSSDDTQHLLA